MENNSVIDVHARGLLLKLRRHEAEIPDERIFRAWVYEAIDDVLWDELQREVLSQASLIWAYERH